MAVYASAKVIRAMQSKYRPHEGAKQQSKCHVGMHNISQYTASRQPSMDQYMGDEKEKEATA